MDEMKNEISALKKNNETLLENIEASTRLTVIFFTTTDPRIHTSFQTCRTVLHNSGKKNHFIFFLIHIIQQFILGINMTTSPVKNVSSAASYRFKRKDAHI